MLISQRVRIPLYPSNIPLYLNISHKIPVSGCMIIIHNNSTKKTGDLGMILQIQNIMYN